MGRIIIILFALMLIACSPSNLLKRSERLKKRAIERGAIVVRDTTWMSKPIFIRGAQADLPLNPILRPAFRGQQIFKDTTIYQDRIKIKFIHDSIKVICPDSVVVVKVPVKISESVSAGYTWWDLLKAGIFGVVLGILGTMLYRIVRKQ